MRYFRLSWNPKRWAWSDLPHAVYDVNNGNPYDVSWSCVGLRRVRAGDRMFMLRFHIEPKGLIGVATVVDEPFEDSHWDPARAARGDTVLRINLQFTTLSSSPRIPLDELQRLYPATAWTAQPGCILIHDEDGEALIKQLHEDLTPWDPDDKERYIEGHRKLITVRTYARNAKARQSCLEAHGYSCTICGFNFGHFFGEHGENYIEVHHLKPISKAEEPYEIDPRTDLRPVCANCHRMLHKEREVISIDELKNIVSAAGQAKD